jgi:AhpD family alkylhydroperoxidase
VRKRGLEAALMEVAQLRASQLNDDVYRLELHTKNAQLARWSGVSTS